MEKLSNTSSFEVVELSQSRLNDLYRKRFNVQGNGQFAKIQFVLSFFVLVPAMYVQGNAIDTTGVGFWAPIFSLIGSAILLSACKETTYVKLHFALIFEILATAGYIFLLFLAFGSAFPSWYYRSQQPDMVQHAGGFFAIGWWMTAIMSTAGAVELGISFTLVLSSGIGMCQGIRRLEERLYDVKIVREDNLYGGIESSHPLEETKSKN